MSKVDLEQLSTVLGKYHLSSGRAPHANFCCPFCEDEGKTPDQKFKLYINLNTGAWYCFRHAEGGGYKHLLRRLDIYDSNKIPTYEEVAQAYKETTISDSFDSEIQPCPLPKGSTIIEPYMEAFRYLSSRGISLKQVVDYKMCIAGGFYSNRVIVPTFEDSQIVYWVARDITGKAERKYLNPKASKSKVIFNFDSVRARGYRQIIICEGVFSAIAAGNNAVAIFGKTISKHQLQKLIESRFEKYIFAFDGDIPEETYKAAELLYSHHLPVWVAVLPKDKDPDDCKGSMQTIIKRAEPFSLVETLYRLISVQG